MKIIAIIFISILTIVQGQVNIEAMRNTNDSSSLELQFDLDFINTTKKNTEFTYATRYNYLFDNDADKNERFYFCASKHCANLS